MNDHLLYIELFSAKLRREKKLVIPCLTKSIRSTLAISPLGRKN